MSYQRHFWRRIAQWGAVHTPRSFVRIAPTLIALFFFLLLRRARRTILANQRRMFPSSGFFRQRWETFMTFVEFAHCLTEALGAGRDGGCERQVEVKNSEEILEFFKEGRGVVVVTAHAGPWDGAASDLALDSGRPVLLVMDQEGDIEAARIQDHARRDLGVEVVRLGKDPLSALPVLSHLGKGGVTALQLDRAPLGRPARTVDLFGKPFPVPTGPFLLAGVARVPVVPVFSARQGFYRREIRVGKAVWPNRRATDEELEEHMREALVQMEQHLLEFPRQWFHFVEPEDEQKRIEQIQAERARAGKTYRRKRRSD